MTTHPYRHLIVVADAERLAAEALAVAMESDVGGYDSFNVPLSSDGELPATHWLCNGVTTEAQQLPLWEAGLEFSTMLFWRLTNPGHVLDSTNCEASLLRIGQIVEFDDLLADAGLMRVSPPIETE